MGVLDFLAQEEQEEQEETCLHCQLCVTFQKDKMIHFWNQTTAELWLLYREDFTYDVYLKDMSGDKTKIDRDISTRNMFEALIEFGFQPIDLKMLKDIRDVLSGSQADQIGYENIIYDNDQAILFIEQRVPGASRALIRQIMERWWVIEEEQTADQVCPMDLLIQEFPKIDPILIEQMMVADEEYLRKIGAIIMQQKNL